MAKYVTNVEGSLEALKQHISQNIDKLGVTVSEEDGIDGKVDEVSYWIGNFERFAALGGNRCSLTVLLMEYSQGVRVVVTSAGGSNAMFIKINYWSEEKFLKDFIKVLEEYTPGTGEQEG